MESTDNFYNYILDKLEDPVLQNMKQRDDVKKALSRGYFKINKED